MILCVTPNPAIDRVSVVPGFRLGQVHRATQGMISLGGKGVNAARAIHILGGQAVCTGFLGGQEGRHASEMLAGENIGGAWTWISGKTRTSIVIVDDENGQASVVNEQGPTVTVEDWKHLRATTMRAAERATCICVCGTLPPGSPIEEYTGLIRNLRDTNKMVWVDTSGVYLQAVLTIEGIHIKVNHDEAGAILDKVIEDSASVVEAAKTFRRMGAASVGLTLGSQGAILVTKAGQWQAQPPPVQVVSGVGSGDSFMAGLALALTEGRAAEEAIVWGTAAGAANALSIGSGRFRREEFEKILSETTVREL